MTATESKRGPRPLIRSDAPENAGAGSHSTQRIPRATTARTGHPKRALASSRAGPSNVEFCTFAGGSLISSDQCSGAVFTVKA